MSDYKLLYQKKMQMRGSNARDRNFKNKQREFNYFFNNSLTRQTCLINGVEEELIFQDHSQSNNKDLSDDKYVIAQNTTAIGVGDYITWSNGEWLIFTEEFKTIQTHQQLKVKAVNENIKWIVNGKICNDSKGWGAYVQSQTLYTLGVSVTNNIAAVDSKMMMYMQNNKESRALRADDRVFIGYKVYKIKFMDPVSRPGLINYLLEEDTISAYDNVEFGVADYYKYYGKETSDDQSKDSSEIVESLPEIIGESFPKISNTYVYSIPETNLVVEEWTVESLGAADNGVYVQSKSDTNISLQFKNDFRYVGNQLTIIARLNNGSYIYKSALISKRF